MKKKYVKDYESLPEAANEKESKLNFVYKGKYYSYGLNREEYIHMCVTYMFVLFFFSLTLLLLFLQNGQGSRTFYVFFPVAFMVMPLAYAWMGVAALYAVVRKRGKTKEYLMEYSVYDTTHNRLRKTGLGLLMLSGAGFMGESALLIFNGKAVSMAAEWLFCILLVILFLLSLAFFAIQRRYICKEWISS